MKNVKDLKKLNTGMHLETLINDTNQYYQEQGMCLCYKKPTPICVLKKNGSQITNAFFEKKSTTDYNGVYQGKYFDFDAKSVKGDSFNVKKTIAIHQLSHLMEVKKHQGIAFILVEFIDHNRYFIIDIDDLLTNKSININDLDKQDQVHFTNKLMLDYLTTLKEKYAIK